MIARQVWILLIATCAGCASLVTYDDVAVELTRSVATDARTYKPAWIPIESDSSCLLPGNHCGWEPDLDGCVATLASTQAFPGPLIAATEIRACMTSHGWHLVLDDSLVIKPM